MGPSTNTNAPAAHHHHHRDRVAGTYRGATSVFSLLGLFTTRNPLFISCLFFGTLGSFLFTGVSAHGYVQEVSVSNGQWYAGFDDSKWNDRPSSAVMITDYLEPNYDVNSREIACGKNAKPAQQIATVRPGDQLRWRWVTHSGDRRKPWTHNEGTHRSWIGSCNGDCSTTDPTTVQWVELTDKYTGQQTYDGTYWPVRVLASDQAWADTIPSAPNGDYLIRNELTALHYSTKPVGSPRENDHDWGTEFYPSCMAIRIQGSDGSYDMGMAVSFPGAYNINISGHYNPDLWANPNSVGIAVTNKYPRTAGTTNGVGGTNPNTNNGNSNNGPAPAPAPAPAPTASSSSTTTALEANAPVPSSRPNPICTRRKSKRGLEKANKKRRVLKRRSNAGGHAGHAH